MEWNKVLFLIPYLLALAIITSIFFYAWRHRHIRGGSAYTWYVAGQVLWAIGYILELLAPSLSGKIFWDSFQWIAGFFIVIAFPVFAVEYTGYQLKRPKLIWGLVSIVPVAMTLLVLTDSQHHLIYPNPHLFYDSIFPELEYDFTGVVYGYAIYSYLVTFTGLGLLVNRMIHPHRLYRRQIFTVALGFFIPIFFTILTVAGVNFMPYRDVSILTFALGNLIVAWGLFRYHLFDIVPIARDLIIENMGDLVVVLDIQDRIVDINSSALTAINQESAQVIGQPAESVLAKWPDLLEKFDVPENIKIETIIYAEGRPFQYEVKSTLLHDKNGRYIGRVFVSRDISEHTILKSQLQKLNEELEERVAKRTLELRESAERYRAVVEHQTEFIVRWRPDRTRTFVNEAYCRYFGLTHKEAITVDFLTLVYEEDRHIVQKNVSRLEAGEIDGATEIHRVIKADGSIGWNEWVDTAIRDENGKITEFQSVGRDITERKRTEETILKQLAFEELMTVILTRFATCPHDEIDTRVQEALQQIGTFMKVERAFMFIIDPEHRKAWRVTHEWNAPHIPPFSIERRYILFGRFPWIENQVLRGLVTKIKTLDDYPPEASAILKQHQKDGTKSVLNVPVRGSESLISGCVVVHTYSNTNTWTDDDITHLKIVGDAIANLLERQRAEEMLLNAYDTTLEGWAKALEMRDEETKDHSQRVMDLTIKLAQAMGVTGDELTQIRRGAILHDIGKMAIPDEILRKRGALTIGERKIVEQHPARAYELLAHIPFLEKALDIPYCHHEHWDGSGYPRGLKGDEIPLAARIFSIVDVWDAVQSDRPYNKAWPQEKAIQYLKDESGKYFDPECVPVFLDLVEQGKI
jgi:PAS domain S-box-containing protein/putative nucleotidyltransferase with HDIG domain